MKKMTNKRFLNIHSSIYAIFALGLFTIPHVLWPIYGLELNDKYSVFLSQHTSIFLAGIAIIGFMLNEIPDKSKLAKKFMLSLVLTNVLGVIITLYACFTDIFHGFGWSDPAFFTFLTIMSFLQWQNNKKQLNLK